MKEFDLSNMPTAVNVTLHKYNYIDNKLWTQLHNQVDYITITPNSIMCATSQIRVILENNYVNDINKIKSVGSDVFYKEVNTIFFLYQMIMEMENLNYIKLDLGTNKAYSRLHDFEGSKLLKFEFKTLSATLNLSDLYTSSELKTVNKYLIKMGVFEENTPYTRIRANALSDKIDMFIGDNEEEYEVEVLLDIMDILEPALEPDKTLLLLITDY